MAQLDEGECRCVRRLENRALGELKATRLRIDGVERTATLRGRPEAMLARALR